MFINRSCLASGASWLSLLLIFNCSTCFGQDLPRLTEKIIKNLTYSNDKMVDGACSVKNDNNPEDGYSSDINALIIGKVNSDGSQDAAVSIGNNPYLSTGYYVDLYIVHLKNDDITIVGPLGLGDHTGVKFLKIGQGRLEATLTVYGREDPHCCPSTEKKVVFSYSNNKISGGEKALMTQERLTGIKTQQTDQKVVHFSCDNIVRSLDGNRLNDSKQKNAKSSSGSDTLAWGASPKYLAKGDQQAMVQGYKFGVMDIHGIIDTSNKSKKSFAELDLFKNSPMYETMKKEKLRLLLQDLNEVVIKFAKKNNFSIIFDKRQLENMNINGVVNKRAMVYCSEEGEQQLKQLKLVNVNSDIAKLFDK